MRPAIDSAMTITTPAAVERRVLQLVDPENDSPASGTTTNIAATLQVLLPGGHGASHTMNALRFVMEGKGAYTSSTAELPDGGRRSRDHARLDLA